MVRQSYLYSIEAADFPDSVTSENTLREFPLVIATVAKVSRKRGLWLVVRVNKKAAAIQILSAQQRLSILFRVIGNSGLADHVDFDLSRILQALFDLLGYISCEKNHIVIADLLLYYHNAHFASRLDRKGLVYSLEGVCDLFKLF